MNDPHAMNPAWVAIALSGVSMIVTAFVAYFAALRGTAVALARFEERQGFQGAAIERLRNDADASSELVNDHETRLSVLEKVIDFRGPPLDHVRR